MSQGLIWSVLVLVDSFLQVVEFEVTEKLSKSVQKKSKQCKKSVMQSVSNNLHICLFIYILIIKLKRTINKSSCKKVLDFYLKQ